MTQLQRSTLLGRAATDLADNTNGAITPALLRTLIIDTIDSLVNSSDDLSSLQLSMSKSLWTGKKWAALGSSITADTYYTAPLATLLGATLTNLGYSAGSFSSTSVYGPSQCYNQITSIPVDVDLVTVEAGINDFRGNSTLGALGDTTLATFYGAIYKTVIDILAVNPSRTVVLITAYGNADSVATGKWNTNNDNGVSIKSFQQAVLDVARFCGVPAINICESGIGGPTASIYMRDNIHLSTLGGQRYAEFIANNLGRLLFASQSAVAAPTFSPVAGSYGGAQTVSISTATSGATIYYTTDGSTPTTGSSVYSAAISVTSTTTIKAMAVKSGLANSSVSSATYTISTAGWSLSAATLGQLSATGATLTSIDGNGELQFTRTNSAYAALWFATGGNNACEVTLTGTNSSVWPVLGDGAGGIWFGVGDIGNGPLTYRGQFSADGSIDLAAITQIAAQPSPALTTGSKLRMSRVGTVVTIEIWNGSAWVSYASFNLTSISGVNSAYFANVKLGLLAGNSFYGVKDIKTGTYS